MSGPSYPSKILQQPFNYSGVNRNNIPLTSSSPNASYQDGFPPVTMEAYGSGGVPPAGQDFNGIFYDLSDLLVWINSGGLFIYNAAFAGAVGYPVGARVISNDGTTVFECLLAATPTLDPNALVGGAPVNVDNIHWCVADGPGDYQTDTGADGAHYVITTAPVTNLLYNGAAYTFKAAHSSTGAATLNVGPGAVALVRNDGGALSAGDIVAGTVYACVYDALGNHFMLLASVNSQATIPTGAIMPYAGSAAPSGWVLCDGASYSEVSATYAALYAVIGTTFGTGGAGLFKVPNLSAAFPMGVNGTYALGATGGSATAIMSHTHFMFSTNDGDFSTGTHVKDAPNNPVAANSSGAGHVEDYVMVVPGTVTLATAGKTSVPQDATVGTNSLPPFLALNYIIKL